MKKNIIASYLQGIFDTQHGEGYSTLMRYFIPEFINAFLLFTAPIFIDAFLIGSLKSTPMYATLGVTNNLLHWVIKIAEAFSIGAIILVGHFNGKEEYTNAGRAFKDAFWISVFLGFIFSSFLFFGAPWIYYLYGVPAELIPYGVPFLQIRAIGIFFMFLYLAMVGFLRGIKNPRAPMKIFVGGTVLFIVLDYALIFGKFGFPALGMNGSALASVVQYAFMFFIALIYILSRAKYRKYGLDVLRSITQFDYVKELFLFSWPIIIDKSIMAWAYIWLCGMINPMGTCCVASFCIVKDMERFAFLPAIAFAQVVTFVVSNEYGQQNWRGIKSTIKKGIFLSSFMVFALLMVLSVRPIYFIQFFDRNGDFTSMASTIFPIISVLVIFDLLQLILAGALRGAGNVKTVMITRLLVVFIYFIPVSYYISRYVEVDPILKFILIYGSFYLGNAIMSIAYIWRFRGQDWKKIPV